MRFVAKRSTQSASARTSTDGDCATCLAERFISTASDFAHSRVGAVLSRIRSTYCAALIGDSADVRRSARPSILHAPIRSASRKSDLVTQNKLDPRGTNYAGRISAAEIQRFAAASTAAGVTALMQRWSVGQRRRKHGLQYGFSCTILKRVVTGAVPKGSVGPKTATTGRPTAAATCMAPESFPTKTWHWDNSPGKSAMEVFPVRSIGACRIPATIAAETGASAAVPKRIISASDADRKRLLSSAKRSGGQHFAEP